VTPSKQPVVENAQQLPHCPWSLTPVTAPFDLQSTSLTSPAGMNYVLAGYYYFNPKNIYLNSS
jgi:hypothetical protein